MAGSINPEGAINAIRSILIADLPAKLNTLDAEYNDGIVLDDPVDYWRAPIERYDNYPACVIVARGSNRPDEYRNDTIQFHELEIQVLLAGNEATAALLPYELLTVRLQRTIRAIQEVLEAKTHLTVSANDNADHLLVTQIDYSDFFPVESRMRRDARMIVLVLIST